MIPVSPQWQCRASGFDRRPAELFSGYTENTHPPIREHLEHPRAPAAAEEAHVRRVLVLAHRLSLDLRMRKRFSEKRVAAWGTPQSNLYENTHRWRHPKLQLEMHVRVELCIPAQERGNDRILQLQRDDLRGAADP